MELSQLRTFRVVAETLELHARGGAAGPHPVGGEPPDQVARDRARRAALHPRQAWGRSCRPRVRRRSSTPCACSTRPRPCASAWPEGSTRRPDGCARRRRPRRSSTCSPRSSRPSCARSRASTSRSVPRPATDETVADILNGAADVGFASLPVYSPALKIESLFEDELLLVVGRGHRLSGRSRRLDRGAAARAADPVRAGRLDPARDRPVLQQGRHPAVARARVERHLVHQADGRARYRRLAAAGLGGARRGRLGLAVQDAARGAPPAAHGRGHLARALPAVGDSRVPRVRSHRRAELQQMAEGQPRGDEMKPGPRRK